MHATASGGVGRERGGRSRVCTEREDATPAKPKRGLSNRARSLTPSHPHNHPPVLLALLAATAATAAPSPEPAPQPSSLVAAAVAGAAAPPAAAPGPSAAPAIDWTKHRVGYTIMLAGPNITAAEAAVRPTLEYSPYSLGLRDGLAAWAKLPENARPAPPYPFVTVTVEKGQKYALKGVDCPGEDARECAYYEGFISLPTKAAADSFRSDLKKGDLKALGAAVGDATAARATVKPELGGGRATTVTIAEVDGQFVNRPVKIAAASKPAAV